MATRAIDVDTVLGYLYDAEYPLKISAYNADGNEVILIENAALYEYMLNHYSGFSYYYSGIMGATDSFLISWNSFLIRNQRNLDRQYQALEAEYDPIDNYYIEETETEGRTYGGTVTTDTDGTKTQTGTVGDSGTTSATASIYGYNSGNGVNSDGTTGTSTNTRTHNLTFGDDTTTTETRDTTSDSERTLNRHGNIGVTLPSRIIDGELAARTHDIAIELIQRFAREYLHYYGIAGGDE